MAAAPITPNEAFDFNGEVVTVFVASAAGAGAVDVTLSTYHPKIDIRRAHPVLSMAALQTETSSTGSQNYTPAEEMARGVAPDSDAEWTVKDISTVTIWRGADKDFVLMLTYFAYGVQLS